MKVIIFKALTVLFFIGVILVNYLANSLPLNNRSTGQISRLYPSFFTPSGFAFSIWGIIYLLLGIVVFKILFTESNQFFNQFSEGFLILFFITCITNVLWLFCWHYDKILLSSIVMLIFLVALAWITFSLTDLDQITRITFSIYTGWLSIAFIANMTILFVKADLPFFKNSETMWYIIIMIVGVILGLLALFLTRNIFYTGVFVWAYFAIFMKHINQTGYYLPKSYHLFNGGMLALLVIGLTVMLVINDFKMFKQ